MDGLTLCVVGILAGWLVTLIYARRASEEQERRFKEQERFLQERIKELMGHLTKAAPEVAAKMQARIDAPPMAPPPEKRTQLPEPLGRTGDVADGHLCSKCRRGHFQWHRWGPGPYGFFTAWYKCDNPECGEELPNDEVFEALP